MESWYEYDDGQDEEECYETRELLTSQFCDSFTVMGVDDLAFEFHLDGFNIEQMTKVEKELEAVADSVLMRLKSMTGKRSSGSDKALDAYTTEEIAEVYLTHPKFLTFMNSLKDNVNRYCVENDQEKATEDEIYWFFKAHWSCCFYRASPSQLWNPVNDSLYGISTSLREKLTLDRFLLIRRGIGFRQQRSRSSGSWTPYDEKDSNLVELFDHVNNLHAEFAMVRVLYL